VADYVDLADLAELIRVQIPQSTVAKACGHVIDTLKAGFVVKSGFKGSGMAHSKGVSIYFPVKKISPLYAKLDFAKKTAWDNFLKEYQGAIARKP